ncbi:MAG: SpoIIE family protein phosphatase [Brevinematales bacterium]|nr:SpoIIE family protein phosphatase [Brevinematales bacterium]
MDDLERIILEKCEEAGRRIIKTVLLQNITSAFESNVLNSIREKTGPDIRFFQYDFQKNFPVAPFYPFLEIIKTLLTKTDFTRLEKILKNAGVYSQHIRIFRMYLTEGISERDEEIIDEEQAFEIYRMKESVTGLLAYLSRERPFCILLENIQDMSISSLELLEFINHKVLRGKGVIILTYVSERVSAFEKQKPVRKSSRTGDKGLDYIIRQIIEAKQVGNTVGDKPFSKGDIHSQIGLSNNLLNFFNLPECKSYTLELYAKIGQMHETAGNLVLKVLTVLGDVHKFLNENDGALLYYNLLIDNARKFNETILISRTLRRIGFIYFYRGNLEEAKHQALTGIKLTEQYGYDDEIFLHHFSLYLFYQHEQRNHLMREEAEILFKLIDKVNKPNHAAIVYLVDLYDPDSGYVVSRKMAKGISIFRRLKNRFRQAQYYHQAGAIQIYSGRPEEGLNNLQKARRIYHRIGEYKITQKIYNSLGYHFFISGRYAESLQLFYKALELVISIKDYYETTITVFNIAFLLFFIYDYRLALEYFEYLILIMKALDLRFIPYHPIEEIYLFCGIICRKFGLIKEAEYYFSQTKTRILASNTFLEDWAEPRVWVYLYHALTTGEESYFIKIVDEMSKPRNNNYFTTVAPHLYLEYGRFLRDTLGDPVRAAKIFDEGLALCGKKDPHPFARFILKETGHSGGDTSVTVPRNKIDALAALLPLIEQERNINKIHSLIDRIHFLNSFQSQMENSLQSSGIIAHAFKLIRDNMIVETSYFVLINKEGKMFFMDEPSGEEKAGLESMMEYLIKFPSFYSDDAFEHEEIKKRNPFHFYTCASFVIEDKNFGKYFFLYGTKRLGGRIAPEDFQILSLLSSQLVSTMEKYHLYEELEKERNDLYNRNKLIDNELLMARKIQSNMIPQRSPMPGTAFFYLPMEQLGGDFFDFIRISPEKIGVFISDVSGHGVSAAFITSMIKSYILQTPYRDDPAQFLIHLNYSLFNQTAGLFITAFYGIIDFSDHTLRFSNAGHNLPFLLDQSRPSDEPEMIPCTNQGVPIGVFSMDELIKISKEYINQEIPFAGNSRFVFYTDGLTETVNIKEAGSTAESKDYESVRFLEILKSGLGKNSQEFLNMVYTDLVAFRGSKNFDDDICMICIDVP